MAGIIPRELAFYRIESAIERLNAARLLFKSGLYYDSVSRSYYSIFQAARAALATRSLDSRKHSGVISLFNQNFVKTGILSKEYTRILKNVKDLRQASDYNDFYIISLEEAQEAVTKADQFVEGIREFLNLYKWE